MNMKYGHLYEMKIEIIQNRIMLPSGWSIPIVSDIYKPFCTRAGPFSQPCVPI